MEIINAVIENTDSPEVQTILAGLKPEEDNLFTNEREDGTVEVEYIEPINNIRTIGTIPAEIISGIKEKYGDKVSSDIYDYVVTFDQGLYGLAVDISVEEIDENKPPKERRLPLPLLIVVGVMTAILTVVLIIVKLIFDRNKD